MMADLTDRAKALYNAQKPGQELFTSDDMDKLELHADISAAIDKGEYDHATLNDLRAKRQMLERDLDTSITRGEKTLNAANPTIEKAKILAAGVPKAFAMIPAAGYDLMGEAYSRATGIPKGESGTEFVNSLFPRPTNPDEQRMDAIGQFLGGAGSNVVGKTPSIAEFLKGLVTESGAVAGGRAGETVAGPVGGIIGGALGGGAANTAVNAGANVKRAIAREATEGYTPEVRDRLVRGIAEGQGYGVNLTPAQVEGAPDILRNFENWTAGMRDSRVRAQQQPQAGQILRAPVVESMPGEVMDPQLLANLGRRVSAAELQRIKNLQRAAYRTAITSGNASPEQVAALDRQLANLSTNSNLRDVAGFQDYIQRLRAGLYEQGIEPEIIPGGRTMTMNPHTGAGTVQETPPTVVDRSVQVPILDPDRISTRLKNEAPPFVESGAGSGLARKPALDKAQAGQVKRVYQENIPQIAEADAAYIRAGAENDLNLKRSKTELGAWLGKKGDIGTEPPRMQRLSYLLDKGIDPKLPRAQNPIHRFEEQTRGIPESTQFLASALKTKVSEILSRVPESGDKNLALTSQLRTPREMFTLQTLIEANAARAGRSPEEQRQIARGLNRWLQTLEAVERRATSGRGLPEFSKGESTETGMVEAAAAAQYAPRAAYMLGNYSKGLLKNIGRKWLDENLTTVEGLDYMRDFAKHTAKGDAAQGALMGAIMSQMAPVQE